VTVAEISHAIQELGPLTYIRESGYTYPMIMATHLASIAVFGGLILMTDLRLLGWALMDMSITDVVKTLRPWKYLGFVIIVTCGLLLGTSEMDKYYGNPYFQLKMFLLAMVAVHALVFRKSVYLNTEALDRAGLDRPDAGHDRPEKTPAVAKRAGAISLIIWIGIACCGRWIAYYEPPKRGRNGEPISLRVPRPALSARLNAGSR
jgi:hypothetical protein